MNIWFKPAGKEAEIIDDCTPEEAREILYSYRMSYHLLEQQRLYGADKMWIGRREDEPRWPRDFPIVIDGKRIN